MLLAMLAALSVCLFVCLCINAGQLLVFNSSCLVVQLWRYCHLQAVRTILRKPSIIFTGPLIWNQLNPYFHILPSVATFKFNYKSSWYLYIKFISVRLPCMVIFYVWLLHNISSKIVPLEKGVAIYGANALSLLPVVLFVLPINAHVWLFPFLLIS